MQLNSRITSQPSNLPSQSGNAAAQPASSAEMRPAKRFGLRLLPGLALGLALGLAANSLAFPEAQTAFAETLGDLETSYHAAMIDYQQALDVQEQKAQEFKEVDRQIQQLEEELEVDQRNLEEQTVRVYKSFPGRAKLLDMVMGASTIDEAFACWDDYQRIERYYLECVKATENKRVELARTQSELKAERETLAANVEAARQNAQNAEDAYRDADHSDGAQYHQLQGVSNNCGATAFIVGVNTLLHENRYLDNVGVWAGPGFGYNSTGNLAYKGAVWLAAMGLADQISIETIWGDIHTADQMRAELEQGHVVVTSSGSGSVWRYADGSAIPGLFPDGHWIVFYAYQDGVFYANDSSVGAWRGAGCPYTADELQQWLNGRYNHFSVSLAKI